jgi:hypothetical protein
MDAYQGPGIPGNGGLGNVVPQRGPDVYDELRNAQMRFADACHAQARAAEERAMAEKLLTEISSKVQQVMAMAMHDPTMPQAAQENQLRRY